MSREYRIVPVSACNVQIEEREGTPPKISGYAAVYYDGTPSTEYVLFPGLVERIMPGAFDRCVKSNPDVRALFNHDSNQILGRTSSGTCRLTLDSRGLKYEIDPPESPVGQTVREALRRKDVTGSSFSFSLERGNATYRDEGKYEVREITDFSGLYDVGPVTFPAYEGTTAYSRSEDVAAAKAEYDQRQAEKAQEAEQRNKDRADLVNAFDKVLKEVFASQCRDAAS